MIKRTNAAIGGAAIFSAMLVLASPAFATVINFDDQPTNPVGISGIALTNQYAPEGVLFNGITASQSFKFNIVPPSSPNYASPFFSGGTVGDFVFVDPLNSAIPTFVNQVSFTLVGLSVPSGHPGNYSGATIDALDMAGNVIPGETQVIPATSTATPDVILTFTGPIHEIRFTQTAGTSGALPIDNLTFTPEPGTWVIVGVSLIGLAALRQRRRFAA